MQYMKTLLPILLVIGTQTIAAEHREHGAHEHGGGDLNVVLEGDVLAIDLSLPAMNIVGFEHPVRSDEERQQVQQAVSQLQRGDQVFIPNAEAGCTLAHATVESSLLENAGDHASHEEHDHEHADFDVEYEFRCSQVSKLSRLTVGLFGLFPGTQYLRAQVISPGGQTGSELDVDHAVITLK